jgi:hypothetical protein
MVTADQMISMPFRLWAAFGGFGGALPTVAAWPTGDRRGAASSAPYRAGTGSAVGGQADEGACLRERKWPAVAFAGVGSVAGAGIHHD